MVSLLFGAFIAFFLIFFEPFEINISSGKNTIGSLFFYGVISAFVLLIFLYVLPLFLPNFFSDKHWMVKHQIIFCSVILFIIATLNGLYTNYINSISFSWSNYWWIINRTFVLGSIPFSFFILIDFKRRDVINKELALNMLNEKNETKQKPKIGIYSIVTDLKNEIFTFEDRDFSYAVAEGNYTDFYFSNKGELNSVTYRISLSSFEKQINSSNLQRCHRSYLVNLDKVINISGNAQGLKLTLDDDTSEIPVSRKYISVIKASLLKKF